MPANGGLFQIGEASLDSQSLQLQSEIGESLRRIFEIFPLLRDSDRRPGSIDTAAPSLQCNLPNSAHGRRQIGFTEPALPRRSGSFWLGKDNLRGSSQLGFRT